MCCIADHTKCRNISVHPYCFLTYICLPHRTHPRNCTEKHPRRLRSSTNSSISTIVLFSVLLSVYLPLSLLNLYDSYCFNNWSDDYHEEVLCECAQCCLKTWTQHDGVSVALPIPRRPCLPHLYCCLAGPAWQDW